MDASMSTAAATSHPAHAQCVCYSFLACKWRRNTDIRTSEIEDEACWQMGFVSSMTTLGPTLPVTQKSFWISLVGTWSSIPLTARTLPHLTITYPWTKRNIWAKKGWRRTKKWRKRSRDTCKKRWRQVSIRLTYRNALKSASSWMTII